MDDGPFPPRLFPAYFQRSVVPYNRVKSRIAYAAFGAFTGVGDGYFAPFRKSPEPAFRRAPVFIIKREIPGAVKAFPGILFPHKLGPGIARLITFHVFLSE
jgi:hypothetical protein